MVDGGIKPAHALTGADNAAGVLTVKVLRPTTGGDETGTVRALDLKGLPLGEAPYAFKSGNRETDAALDLPVEIRNDIARLEIGNERSAGAVQLLDKRWRRRTVGVITGSTAETAQPLLASTFYLSRALSPFADIRIAERASPAEAVAQFIEARLPMIVLADVGNVAGDAHGRLERWIDEGGVLVRFAGPRLAASDDDLVPVRLRRGGRILGGSLSWDKPQQLAAFSRESPFNGMLVPNDVTVTRQVLAEPDAGLSEHTWATLGDGTPLVTAAKRGKGMIVLFHVTADTRWSDLPLSGAFVDMLKRVVGLSGAVAATEANAETGAANARDAIPPTRTLDGFGAFEPPPPTARPILATFSGRATADNPPGFYGPPEGLVAVNTLAPSDRLQAIDFAPLNARVEYYRTSEPQDLRGPIFLTALALLLIDALVVFWLAGGLYRLLPRRGIAASVVTAFVIASAGSAARSRGARRRRADRAVRFAGEPRNAPRLCRDRRCRDRLGEQVRPAGPDAVPRPAHRARSRRSHRRRHQQGRARLLPADLLADRAGDAEAVAGSALPHRRLHEAGRHRAVRHARRGAGAARSRRRGPQRRHVDACARSSPRSTFPSSSRSRRTTC